MDVANSDATLLLGRADEVIEREIGPNVRYWHKAGIARLSSDVRSWGRSGHRCLSSEWLFLTRSNIEPQTLI